MKPRPLTRSITFWSGILVMAFICWAWWDSMLRQSSMGTPNYEFTNFAALVAMHHYSSPWHSVPFEMQRDIVMRDGGIPPFGKADFERGGDPNTDNLIRPFMAFSPPADWILLVPHWLILLAVALPWLGILLWRARRIRRASASEDPS